MRIRSWTINGDFTALRATGVARYASEVTQALNTLIADRHPLTTDLDLQVVAPAPFKLTHIPVHVVPEFRSPRLPQFWVQFQLPRHVRGGLLSFCNLAPVTVAKHIVCIHDLHTFLMPESYGLGFRLAHRAILPLLGKFATRITTVSELSREHLVHYGIARNEKIITTYNGCDHALRWNAERSTLKLDDLQPFVLFFWRSQKYKNNELILKIAEPLAARGINIVLVGEEPDNAVVAAQLAAAPNIKFVGRIDDNTLAYALSKALCLIFPSRIEGFGLPAVEAMALGCAVIASSSRCLPEICGGGALYADPDDPSAWVEAIVMLHSDPESKLRLIARGKTIAEKYSWRKIAEIYLAAMAEADRDSAKARG